MGRSGSLAQTSSCVRTSSAYLECRAERRMRPSSDLHRALVVGLVEVAHALLHRVRDELRLLVGTQTKKDI